jgi:predicted nuclease of predicted toxin-antitoxin system
MRVLIDACLPVQLKAHLPSVGAKTARELGWQLKSNGELLAVAQNEFDVLLTMDKGLPAENYLARFAIALVVVRARSNRLPDLLPLLPAILAALSRALPGKAVVVTSAD